VTGSVCLVDANLRHPGLHEQFAVENQFGLADALQGSEPLLNYARSMSRPNLWLVSSGSSPEAALPLLGSERMRQGITELRSSGLCAHRRLCDERLKRRSCTGLRRRRGSDGIESELFAPRNCPQGSTGYASRQYS